MAKSLFDFIIGLVCLLVLSPLLLTIAILVKLDSSGPIFYRGVRIGRYGRSFKILKFRTMHQGAEALGTTTAKNDPRVTKIGRVLRKYKLDELPQLINVIKGEMSLVGPRPEVQEHTDAYNDEEKMILSVLPGITDYSSIRFASLDEVLGSENPHQVYVTKIRAEKNQLRLQYVRDCSFSEDLKIIWLTLITIIGKAK